MTLRGINQTGAQLWPAQIVWQFFSGKVSPFSSCFCFLWEIFGALSKSTDGWPARRQGWVSVLSICKPSVCQAVSPGEGTAGMCLDWIEGLMRTAACLELVGSGNNCPRWSQERMTLITSASLPVSSQVAYSLPLLNFTPPPESNLAQVNWVSPTTPAATLLLDLWYKQSFVLEKERAFR